MTSGPLGALTALANAWTTPATWWVCWLFALLGLLALLLRAVERTRDLAGDRRRARELALSLVIGFALFALALGLRLLLPERVHYTYGDEYEYLVYARQLLATGAYTLWSGPPAGVWLYAVATPLAGGTARAAFLTTIVLASASVPVLVWTLRTLRVERAVALAAGLLLVVAPLHVKHSASASLEVASLLFVLLAIGSFVELLRAPQASTALGCAASLFFALTVRVENWTLVALLPLLAWAWRDEARRPQLVHLVPALLAVVLAAAYVPGIVATPIRYTSWWKSQLPAPHLLATNLAFWVAGDPLLRKLPLLVATAGAVALVRRAPRALLFWLAFTALYSVVFVLYGLNIGWLPEAHQPPPWGLRENGHDMMRFDVILLPPVLLLLASGLVTVGRGVIALVRGHGRAAHWTPAARGGVLLAGVALGAVLLATGGEAGSYRPLAFVASHYNRAFEIAEYRFLRDALARHGGATCYVLPPSEGVFFDGVAVKPLAALDADLAAASPGAKLVYVNQRQLAVPELRAQLHEARMRHPMREVERGVDGRDRFYLLAVE